MPGARGVLSPSARAGETGTGTCAGKAAGILTADTALSRRYLELGATFVAVGLDTQLLVRGAPKVLNVALLGALSANPLQHAVKLLA